MNRIGIIGAGGIGSRHLQALALYPHKLNIDVVDISCDSLDIAKKRFESVDLQAFHNVCFIQTIDEMSDFLDVVIIATGSLPRRKIVEELLGKKSVNHLILEKVLFPCIQDYKDMSILFKKNNVQSWVNCPSRMNEEYKLIKEEIKGYNFEYHLGGNNFGLACNAIHFLDIICFLGDDCDCEIYSDQLDEVNIASKRSGYIEFTGTLYGKSKHCSFFSLHASRDEKLDQLNSVDVRCMI